jgi:hypothetical protein
MGVELTRSREVKTCKLEPQEVPYVLFLSFGSGEAEIAARSDRQVSPGQKPASLGSSVC